ncbi:RagB/SusD family nutrient uptake outer membrane protein [Chitinophagaceae bacterium LB-8]|uniref:RagB/SusD family nutrient uptake outer membrane protein n=1 Tax=Paraflavisolibacter caeni TaxID=2982496 RepID=A0A9X2XPD5_9BACT|nr:RagB/SusD family nutrient uptake outer membrane protein [Paraflavisolibacter caeni]MCU7550604.1 RagB/SusD family nutrient uptake outer membrane protein [Paraflavisolibacter caeni]
MKYSKIAYILALLVLISSCKKSFLELSPISNANTNAVFKTKSDFDLATNAAYATLYTIYAPKGAMSFTGELMSDNATVSTLAISGSFTIVDQQAFRDYTVASNNTGVYQFWVDYYTSMYQINIVLDKIVDADLDDAYKKQIIAEMKFLRGLYYFNLVQLYGDVPLVTKPIIGEEAYAMKRTPKADVYNFIVEELKAAATDLTEPSSEPAKGRATKGAAKSLLGKVYLTMGDKAKAAQILKEVVDSYGGSKYDLLPSFTSLWGNTTAQKNTKESIFEIQYLGGAANPYSSFWPAFAPFENFSITKYGGGMNMVTDDLYNEYEDGDTRKDASFYTGYTKGGVFVPIKFNKKWVDLTAPLDGGAEACNNNFIVLRYADVLLLLTEATGDPQYMNRVRARAGLPLFGSAGYPAVKYPTIDLAVEHERRMEFALEYQRWFDLKRTGRAVAVLTAKGKAVNANKLLLPVPQYSLNQNPNLAPQNPGY